MGNGTLKRILSGMITATGRLVIAETLAYEWMC
jgi:hypothetical protein